MGYSHYWTPSQPLNPTAFARLTKAALEVIKRCESNLGIALAYEYDEPGKAPEITTKVIRLNGIALAYEYDEPGKAPEITTKVLRLNGRGDDGHETFYLEPGQTGLTFCKTARKAYDVAVVAILCLAEFYSEGTYGVESDGGRADWEEGLALARQTEPKCTLPEGVANP